MKTIYHFFIFNIFILILFSCSNNDNIVNNESPKDLDTNTFSESIQDSKKDVSKSDKKSNIKDNTNTSILQEKKEINNIEKNKFQSFSNNPKLLSWNNSTIKRTILQYLRTISNPNSPNYIPKKDRIVTLDNDGTIWGEQPTYYQIEYVIYRLKELEPQHPEWKKNKLIQTALNHDLKHLREKYGVKGLGELLKITQTGMSTKEFEENVLNWALNSYHPIHHKKYTNLIYKPMQELIQLLKNNGFKVYIVSGGGTDFIRAFAQELFNIDKEFIIGSYQRLEFSENNKQIELIKKPEILCISEDKGKVISIQQIIGKKPVISIGNSDRDIPMLQWSQSSKYKNLQLLVHHTDGEREWKYDKESKNGKLDLGLSEAKNNQWLVIDMKKDWKVIF